jgi:hypothetical protein
LIRSSHALGGEQVNDGCSVQPSHTALQPVGNSAAVGFVSHCHQAGPPPTILILKTMSFPQIRPQLSLDTFKSHDNLVDPNATAFSPNAQHESYYLDTSVRLSFPNIVRFTGSNFLQKEHMGDFYDEDDGDFTARTAYPPTSQLPPPDRRTWWQKVCISLHDFTRQNLFSMFSSFTYSSYQTRLHAVSMLSQC